MLQILLNKKSFSINFLKFIKKLFKRNLIDSIKDIKYNRLKDYVSGQYKISLEEILNRIGDCLSFSESKDDFIIYLDENQKINNIKISELVSLIDYGNIKVKGTLLIRDSFNYFHNNMFILYSYYLMVKDK